MLLTREQIIQTRTELGISQTELAALLKVHKNSLCRYEKGKTNSLRIQVRATEYFSQRLLRGLS